jgi:lactoylglutathione lyase
MSAVPADSAAPAPAGLGAFKTGHLGINVSELDRSRAFYQRVFGLDVVHDSQQEGRRFAFLAKEASWC